MIHVRKKFASDGSGQELLPGIPDHITIQNIFPKTTWKSCNVLQIVSRGWQQMIYNRSVYNSKVFSGSTEGLLVLPYQNQESKVVLILYACKDGSFLQLPACPVTRVDSYDCICLDGRVYLWMVTYCSNYVEGCVLDLVGDRKWTQLKQTKKPSRSRRYGVLDGKICRFLESMFIRGILTIDFDQPPQSMQGNVQSLSRLEMYDPVSDVWSLATPEPLINGAEAVKGSVECHQASFWGKTAERMAEDHIERQWRKKCVPSFSEWRRGRQITHCEKPSTLAFDCQDTMAAQVYSNTFLHPSLKGLLTYAEDLYPLGEKSKGYDTLAGETDWVIWGWASVDNVIWATVGRKYSPNVYLFKNPMSLREDSNISDMWVDTGFSQVYSYGIVRPIYV